MRNLAYKLLGIAVWRAVKFFLQTKYGTATAPKPLLAAGMALAIAGAIVAARQASSAGDE